MKRLGGYDYPFGGGGSDARVVYAMVAHSLFVVMDGRLGNRMSVIGNGDTLGMASLCVEPLHFDLSTTGKFRHD